MNQYLRQNKTNIREFFSSEIFRPSFDDPPMECNEDAIFLKPLIDMLKSINIELDTVDIYCIYTRLKIMENSEAISINLLEKELKNMENNNDIMDSLSSNNENTNPNNNNLPNNDSNDKSKSIDGKLNVLNNRTNSNDNISNINLNNLNPVRDISEEKEKKTYKNEIAIIDDSESDPVDFDDTDSKIEYESSKKIF